MDFSGQVVLVTGSSRGLGRAFARFFAGYGAHVFVNSTSAGGSGQATADQIAESGGTATHVPGRVEDGDLLVAEIIKQAGRLDAIVHNAGFVRDKTLRKMSAVQWSEVMDVHLTAAFKMTNAAWPHFEAQGCGRLVFISSASGLYGNFGQGNYAAAKAGMHGLCRTIALEGATANIACNVVAPFGATELNSANMPEELKAVIRPEYIAPLVAYLAHPDCNENGGLFEASAGVFKKVRWERSAGLELDTSRPLTLDAVADGFEEVIDFTNSEHPNEMRESLRGMYERRL